MSVVTQARVVELPFERRSAHLFFQLVARRYERGSTLITTNQLVTQWGTVFGDEVLAVTILDRLLHHSYTLMVQGESYRVAAEEEGRAARPVGGRRERARYAPRQGQQMEGVTSVVGGRQSLLSLDTAEAG